jgi:conserved oligomeric Golgi complex subunit 6
MLFQAALTREPLFSLETLDLLSQNLESFLPSALMDALSRLQKLSTPRLANNLTHRAATLFLDDFTAVEVAIREHVDLSHTVFPWSINEVRLLLGC